MPDTDHAAETGDTPEIVDAPDHHRYEARLAGRLAGFLTYRHRGGTMVLVHTEVDPAFEGHGIAGRLAAAALDHARQEGLVVDPVCPFVVEYIERHPEYARLVAPG